MLPNQQTSDCRPPTAGTEEIIIAVEVLVLSQEDSDLALTEQFLEYPENTKWYSAKKITS